MNDSRDCQDAESVRSGDSHVASQPVSFPPHPVPGGMLSRSVGMPSRKNGPPVSICGIGKNSHHLSQERHPVFLCQGTTSGLTFYPEKLRRLCASMLFWVMFICRVGVSSSCAMAVMCTGMSIVFCSSDESPQTSIHSSTNTFFNVSPVGIQFTYNRPSETLFLFPGALKCWCGTIATMFSQAPRRDSQDLHCFSLVVVPSRW